ncbi:hypothetical protein GW814_03370, partial [Candidatus Falkowbacteria bacterium]|nr:hypothetical protein [Candidatus Falkowbacteria bacterium]
MDYGLSEQNTQVIHNWNLSISLDGWLIYLATALVGVALIFIARKIVLLWALNSKYHEHAIYLLRVPKEKPNERDQPANANYLQNLREKLARAETIFKAIGGLRAQRWQKDFSWLLGRNDHFSFEIVAGSKLISFYVVASKAQGRYLEQQIQAFYPEAVLEEVEDYNIFEPQGVVVGSTLKLTRSQIFPITTYDKMESDPLNSLTNILSRFEKEEGAAVQIVIRSARPEWHRLPTQVARTMQQGKSVDRAYSEVTANLFSKVWREFARVISQKQNKTEAGIDPRTDREYRISPMEEEVVKALEEKTSKAGFDVNIRVVVSAARQDVATYKLNNVLNAFTQYAGYQYGNKFVASKPSTSPDLV